MKNYFENKLYKGFVSHYRFSPKIHKFKYDVFKIFLNLENIEESVKKYSFFSLNKFNIYSFYYKDHLDNENSNPYLQAKKIFTKHKLYENQDKIYILCYPRILGYVFNPLSLYFCISNKNEIKSILYEVHNTFGDKHFYLSKYKLNSIDKVNKVFHVSPFFNIEGEYEFNSILNDDFVNIQINYFTYEEKSKVHLLNATFSAKREELSDKNLLINFIKFPFMTFKVIIAIHINALKLWIKGIKFFSRPNPPRNILSINKSLRNKK